MRRHVVLIGLPGAGKSAVGRRAASALGCPFCDLDARVAAASGMSVAELFAQRGEPAFREAERAAFEQVLAEAPQVVAVGGGWAAQPGNLERALGRVLTVYLKTTPEAAARRLAGTRDRPLLAGDLLGRLRDLAAVRTAVYQRADATVATDDRSVGAVVAEVVTLARSAGGW